MRHPWERFGLGSPESFAALEQLDAMIEQVVESTRRAGRDADATFLLFSDAGAAPVDREYRPNAALMKKGWFKPGASWEVAVQAYGGSAAVFVREPTNEKLVREVEEFFGKIHNDPDSPVWRLFPRREAARLGADPRPVLYLDAAPGFVITDAASGGLFGKPVVRATSGASPSRTEMRGALILAGRGVKPGARLDYARLIDLAPTIARLLGFEMKTARGRALTEALAP